LGHRVTIVATLVALLALTFEACDDDEGASQAGEAPSVERPETSPTRPPDWDIKVACPEEIRIVDRPTCRLIAGRVKFTDCHRPPVAHDVRVSGISCRDAFDLLLPLGHETIFGRYKESRQGLYRPAVATYTQPFKIRSTGWTCWGDFDLHRSYAIQYVCWRGRDVLTFRFE
jgi:hypothetical protein